MIKTFVMVMAATIAASAPTDDVQARILSYEFTSDKSGNYEFEYETSNGLKRKETGEVVNAGQDSEHIVVRGEFSYVDPDGNLQSVSYVADENGYRIEPFVTPQTPPVSFALPAPLIGSLLG